MRTQDAIDHFGSKRELAKALNIAVPSVYDWGETVPPLRQLQLQKITRGALKASANVFETTKSDSEAA